MKKLTCTEKAFIKSHCDETAQGKGGVGVGTHLVYVSAPVSVSTLKCRQCDTLITGDINELKLKLRNGGGVKK